MSVAPQNTWSADLKYSWAPQGHVQPGPKSWSPDLLWNHSLSAPHSRIFLMLSVLRDLQVGTCHGPLQQPRQNVLEVPFPPL